MSRWFQVRVDLEIHWLDIDLVVINAIDCSAYCQGEVISTVDRLSLTYEPP